MIRIVAPSIATSVQDQGRFGYRTLGISRSGAMDPLSLATANKIAGADPAAAGIEFGPGTLVVEVTAGGTICIGGAPRIGVPCWQLLEVSGGQRLELSGPTSGMWSYLAVGGGIDAPVVMGSRSTQVREGIGSWLAPGAAVGRSDQHAPPEPVQPPPLAGPVRLHGKLAGRWRVGARVDRMGYQLEGERLPGGRSDEWSEPLLPGCVQLPPSGQPIILMAEGPTVGGYSVPAVVHSEDLRLVAQTPPGGELHFIQP
ncbi:MAG: biotin-dependent carboxyltransferase family protein [Actinomycetota bacterium]|nr:biotin-dependent carboxyltransferase family protein [Actinomycetota bacterium]